MSNHPKNTVTNIAVAPTMLNCITVSTNYKSFWRNCEWKRPSNNNNRNTSRLSAVVVFHLVVPVPKRVPRRRQRRRRLLELPPPPPRRWLRGWLLYPVRPNNYFSKPRMGGMGEEGERYWLLQYALDSIIQSSSHDHHRDEY